MTVDVGRVARFRETVDKVVSMLTERGLRVTQEGVKAFVEHDEVGKPVLVNIPSIPDTVDETFLQAVRGFIDNTCARVLLTDQGAIRSALRADKSLAPVIETVEDARVEREWTRRFPGSAAHLEEVRRHLFRKAVAPRLALAKNEAERLGALFPAVIHAWAGRASAQEFMDEAGRWEMARPITDRLAALKPRIAGAIADTREAVSLARDILKALDQPLPEEEDEGEGKSSKSEKRSEKKSGKDKSKDKNAGDGRERGSERGEGDSSKDEGSEGKDKGSEGDEGSEGKDKGSEGSEGDEGSEGSEGDEGSESDEGTGSGAPDGGEGSGERGEDSTELGGDASDEESAPGIGGGGAFVTNIKNLSETLSEHLSEGVVAKIGSGTYLPWTTDFDQFVKPDPARGTEVAVANEADRMDAQTRAMVGGLSNQFRRLFAAQDRVVNTGGLRRGRLQTSALHRLAAGDDRVFFVREEHTATDSAVTLLVDCSGSMSGQKIDLALTSANAFSQTLERVGIVNEVLGFTTRDDYHRMRGGSAAVHARMMEAQARLGRGFSRVEGIRMLEFKGFDERVIKGRIRLAAMRSRMTNPYGLANNIDGESVIYAARRLLARRERRKVLIVFSDGYPAAAGDSRHLRSHLKETIEGLPRAGIEALGVGILSPEVRFFYKDHVVVERVEDLPGTVMREMSRILLKGAR